MPSSTDVARGLYVAFERADPRRLLELLHPDFVGHVSGGMPRWGYTATWDHLQSAEDRKLLHERNDPG